MSPYERLLWAKSHDCFILFEKVRGFLLEDRLGPLDACEIGF